MNSLLWLMAAVVLIGLGLFLYLEVDASMRLTQSIKRLEKALNKDSRRI